jgi:hypothetical protein
MRDRSALCRASTCGLVFLLGLPLGAFGDQTSPGTVVEVGESDALEAALKRQGWRVERDSEGGLLLYLPSPEPAAETTSPASPETPEAIEPSEDWLEARDLDGLQRALEAQGWRVQRSAEGDLLVFPVDPAPGETASTQAPDRDPGPGPSAAVGESSTPPATRESGAVSEMIDATDLDALQTVAAERGWAHRREPDGSLVLFPPSLSPAPGHAGPCQIGMIRVAGVEDIGLPVDTEEKAYRLAEFWLREMDGSSIAIGRIRQINRLFLVSVVEQEAPFLLQTQLVIRANDGCLMAIPR